MTTKDNKYTFEKKENYEFSYRRTRIRLEWEFAFDGYKITWFGNNKESQHAYINFKQVVDIYEWVKNLSNDSFKVTHLKHDKDI